jgi:hypothetical protein
MRRPLISAEVGRGSPRHNRPWRGKPRPTLYIISTIALCAATAFAQTQRRDPKKQPPVAPFSQGATHVESNGDALSGAQEFQGWTQTMESQIAGFIQRRPDSTGDAATLLELQIDLRIIERAILSQAADAQGDISRCAIGYLRAGQMQNMNSLIDAWISQRPAGAFAPEQLRALKSIHDLTFKTDDLRDPGKLDLGCATLGVQLMVFTGTAGADGKLPQMRPVMSTTAPVDAGPTQPTEGPPTIADLSTTARQLSISIPLRRELLALADSAAAEHDPNGSFSQMLAGSVDLAKGLQNNTAVDPDTRADIEQKLADGLALYTDPRTRAAGKARIDSLSAYRQLLTRVGRLNLTADQATKFGPALVWARQNPEQGVRVLAAIEKFTHLVAAHAARTPQPGLTVGVRKIQGDLDEQFAAAQGQFMSQALDFSTDAFSTGPEAMEQTIKTMQQADDASDLIARMPKDTKALQVFRPRPMGGLEKLLNQSAGKLADLSSPDAALSLKLIKSVDRLAQAAADLSDGSMNDVAPSVVSTYGGTSASQFEAKWRADVTDIASSLATNSVVDDDRINALVDAKMLRDALKEAAALDVVASKAGELQWWADWNVSADQIKDLLGTYQQSMSDAFTAFVNDDPGPVQAFLKVHARFRPMLALLTQVAGYADQVSKLPNGIMGSTAQLVTPLSNQPFEAQRIASYGLWIWNWETQSNDTDGANAAFAALAKRLREAGVGRNSEH